jgi:hypothetical protein
MTARKRWPTCGCEVRCNKASCRMSGGRRQFLEAKAAKPPEQRIVGRKYSPRNLINLLNQLSRWPNITKACAIAGFSYSSLQYYLIKSDQGYPGDGFDLTWGEETKRFHQHYADALASSTQLIEDNLMERAAGGFDEVLTDKGRVIYRIDPELEALGFTGFDAYLKDENGKPVPESVHKQDPEIQLQMMKVMRREKYGTHTTQDINVNKGGVMVVGVRQKTPEQIDKLEQKKLIAPIDVEFREVEDE